MATRQEKLNDYDAFVDKFKPKKTTDDCYTPEHIYDAVLSFASNRYGFDKSQVVRPFYPGGDYERFDYADDCVVLDNPPFSILSKITDFYIENGIRFFLFAPTLTCISSKNVMMCNHIICGYQVEYENKAKVDTSFITNMDDGVVIESSTDLYRALKDADEQAKSTSSKTIGKYEYPPYVITSASMKYLANHGVDLKIMSRDCCRIGSLDSMKKSKKSIYGGGLLLSENAAAKNAAAKNAAAKNAAATRWELSDREIKIIEMLGKQ